MSEVSVTLSANLSHQLSSFIRMKHGRSTKAAVIRVALRKYLEDQAVEAVIRAGQEPTLEGNLHELLKKFRAPVGDHDVYK